MKKFVIIICVFTIILLNAFAFATDHSGDINSNETWTVAGNPHRITGNVTVANGDTLIIEAGCVVKFDGNYYIQVQGTLIADGTASNHIVFTSNEASPSPGDWRDIYFNEPDSDCILDYCDISYGGSSYGNLYIQGAENYLTITNCNIEYSGDDGIYINDAYTSYSNPIISNCNISNNVNNGIYCADDDSDPQISDCSIQNNGSYPIRTFGDNIKDISGAMTFSGNGNNAIWVGSDDVTTATWNDFGIPYVIGGNIEVVDQDTLTISPGISIKFSTSTRMNVYGALIADGTDSEHITFTSNADTPAAGDWYYIQFSGSEPGSILDYCDVNYGGKSDGNIYIRGCEGNVTITNCNIEYSGESGIHLKDTYTSYSQPTISNCTISNNTNYGIYCDNNDSAPQISDCSIQNNGSYPIRTYGDNVKYITSSMTFSGNGNNAIWVGSDDVTTATWNDFGIPYVIGGNIEVVDQDTLTISPGISIKFSTSTRMNVYGALIADGTDSEHITFTSNADTPAAGDWYYIQFSGSEPGSILDYCDVNYGGKSDGNIYIRGCEGNVTITNCNIEYSGESGIHLKDTYTSYSQPTISNCTISNNTNYGIYCDNNDSAPQISDCSIQNNGSYPIRTYGDNVKYITSSMTFSGNGNNAIWVGSDNVSTGTWFYHDVPYIIGGNITVTDGDTLTINEENTLKFQESLQLKVYGVLVADGSSSNHITFTSNSATREPGDWDYIYFIQSDPGCILDYCDIFYGGQGADKGNIYISGSYDNVSITNCDIEYSESAGIYIYDRYSNPSAPLIANCTINNNSTYGIFCDYNTSGPKISDCSIQNNGSYAIRVYADYLKNITGTMNISGNVYNSIRAMGDQVSTGTWLNHGVPYDLEGDITVNNGDSLTIAAGDTIRFNGSYALNIYGQLNANGTDSEHIIITRSPTYSGYWDYLHFYTQEECNISYCDFTYGGHGYGTIYFQGSSSNVNLNYCTVKYSNSCGLYIIDDSDPTIKNCIIRDNSSYGIYIEGNCHPVFGSNSSEWNDIYRNGLDDIPGYDLRNGNLDIYAKYVYWGADDFASINSTIIDHDDNASLGIVTFSPWESSPHGDLPPNEHAGLISSSSSSEQRNWTVANGPIHYVTAPVTVDTGTTVTIEDGVEVRFTQSTYLKVEGTLNADGSNSITFTRYGAGVEWQGIQFKQDSDGILDNCLIEYVTNGNGYGIYCKSTNPTITNNTVRYSTYGFCADIYIPDTFNGNEFYENTTGMYIINANSPALSSTNTTNNNSSVGVHFYNCTGTPTISNQTITNHAGDFGAIFMQNCHGFQLGSGNSITGNSYPLSIDITSYANNLSNIPTSGNTNNMIQVSGGTTGSNFFWYDFDIPYLITASPTIATGDLLQISSGVIVKFEQSQFIDIFGTLTANGISGDEIYFTRNDTLDTWKGLQFQNGASGDLDYCYIEYVAYSDGYAIYADSAALSLDNCTIENNIYGFYGENQKSTLTNNTFQNNNYGYYVQNTNNPNANFGANNVFSNNSSAGIAYKDCSSLGTIEDLTLQNNEGYGAFLIANSGSFTLGTNTITDNDWPLSIDTGSFPALTSNIPISGNTNNDIRVTSGTGTNTGTWYKFADLNYIVTNNTTLGSAANLTIAKGDSLKFYSDRQLDIYGTFTAIGDDIIFTKDGSPQWQGLYCFNGSTVNIDSCLIQHAKYGINANSCNPAISNALIQNCDYGFYGSNTNPALSGNTIQNNTTGIRIYSTTNPSLTTVNTIQNNSTGIHFYNCTSSQISNQSILNNIGTYGAIYMEECGTFTLGSNTVTGNTFPLTIDIASYPDDSGLDNIPTSGNTNDDVQVYGGNTGSNSLLWKVMNEPLDYIVKTDITVANGGSLTIQDSVDVYFENGACINVYGTLNCPGTAAKNKDRSAGILFSRWETDDSWEGLRFQSGSQGDLDYCRIEYADCGSCYGIYASSPDNLTIDNCTIQYNNYGFYGNQVPSTKLTSCSNNNFTQNSVAIYISNTSNRTVDNTNTISYSGTGVYFNNCSSPVSEAIIENNTNYGITFTNCTSPTINSDLTNCSNGIFFSDCNSIGTIDNISVTNNTGDYGAFRIENSAEFMLGSNNTITGNSWPLSLDCGSFPDAASTIPTSGNTNNDIQVISGVGTKTGTWYKFSGLNYIVNGSPEIDDSLTIDAGNNFKFDNGYYFKVDGTLIATGTNGNEITFTRNDATDEWAGLRFQSGSTGILEYCTVEYGTYNSYYGIYANAADSIKINNCLLQNNYYGFYGKNC
ncbi:MAG: right-handed parallel beta-helix repeat-containing protein, partial [Candidatus Cloacimonetes bacterium]|nr:right-handed parallel beta-helix repeat-containing protein [Candidatus Cloacimonadota bacterium]